MVVSTTPGTVWGTWINLQGGIHSEPAPVTFADDRVQVFIRGGSNVLWSRVEARDGTWGPWQQYPGLSVDGIPAPIRGKDGKVRVFYRTPSNNLEVITQTSINSGYGPPQTLVTGIGDDPAAALGADGRIYVFFPGNDSALWYIRNQDLQYETYSSAASLGGAIFATPSPILDGGGRLVVAVKGAGETLYTIQQQTENSSIWEMFSLNASNVTSRPSVCPDAAGRVQIFYRGSDGSVRRVGQNDDYDTFGAPVSLGAQIVWRPTCALAQDGRINVFIKATDNALWVAVQNTENGTAYSGFQSLGGVVGSAGVGVPILNEENLLYVFIQGSGTARDLWLQRQTFV
ncbi:MULTISPECIES: hypothetical protein [Streptomyces violaceusniger group]|uniref:PLL-like beta propeller domain-containing protein n=2 Tax=Streptomyces javensis TaxID=114698 RepID=A0ABN1WDC6_9ACTN|nr:hypothetical protein [Streptomyces javensis]MBI0314245.1 hypothetical protein [Streptomyces javensis]